MIPGTTRRASRSSSYTAPAVTAVSRPRSSTVAPTTTVPSSRRGTRYTDDPPHDAHAPMRTEARFRVRSAPRSRRICPFTGRIGGHRTRRAGHGDRRPTSTRRPRPRTGRPVELASRRQSRTAPVTRPAGAHPRPSTRRPVARPRPGWRPPPPRSASTSRRVCTWWSPPASEPHRDPGGRRPAPARAPAARFPAHHCTSSPSARWNRVAAPPTQARSPSSPATTRVPRGRGSRCRSRRRRGGEIGGERGPLARRRQGQGQRQRASLAVVDLAHRERASPPPPTRPPDRVRGRPRPLPGPGRDFRPGGRTGRSRPPPPRRRRSGPGPSRRSPGRYAVASATRGYPHGGCSRANVVPGVSEPPPPAPRDGPRSDPSDDSRADPASRGTAPIRHALDDPSSEHDACGVGPRGRPRTGGAATPSCARRSPPSSTWPTGAPPGAEVDTGRRGRASWSRSRTASCAGRPWPASPFPMPAATRRAWSSCPTDADDAAKARHRDRRAGRRGGARRSSAGATSRSTTDASGAIGPAGHARACAQVFVAAAARRAGRGSDRPGPRPAGLRACASGPSTRSHGSTSPSLSARTLVYKGMLTAAPAAAVLPRPVRPALRQRPGPRRTRASRPTPSRRWPLAHPYRYLAHNGEINTLRGQPQLDARPRGAARERRCIGGDLTRALPGLHRRGPVDSATLRRGARAAAPRRALACPTPC